MRMSHTIAIILSVVSAACLAGCSQHQSTPVVNSPVVTTQQAPKEKGWLGRTADATWDVATEPAGWFKPAPKQPKKAVATQSTEPPEPVQILIAPRNPGVIVTDEPAATQPGQ